MEHKIGEVFKFGGEWYQCVEGNDCANCVFIDYCKSHSKEERDNTIGLCVSFDRNDGIHVIFKKLEKVGEPIVKTKRHKGQEYNSLCLTPYAVFQKYKVYTTPVLPKEPFMDYNEDDNIVYIEIKQNKEDMEEKKVKLDKLVTDYTSNKITYNEFEKVVKELYADKEESFSLEAAKQGKPVCTRDGRKARIICFDRKLYHDGYNYPIVAMVNDNDNDNEIVHAYTQDGLLVGNMEGDLDLMMLPEKKEGCINIYNGDNSYNTGSIYSSKEEAEKQKDIDYVDTIKIEWEE